MVQQNVKEKGVSPIKEKEINPKKKVGIVIKEIDAGRKEDAAPIDNAAPNTPLPELQDINSGTAVQEVEGDLKLVINAVNGVSTPSWRLLKLIQDIKTLSNSFEFVCFKHVFREANFVANALASIGYKLSNLCFWEEKIPPKHLLLWILTV
ncbi:hypothetical protein ACLB2K_052964 [Fragaria x ananassa]